MNLQEAIQILKKEHYKHTNKREDILRIFSQHNRYLSAKDVLELLKNDYPNLSFDTIYRNIYLFAKLGILEVTEMNGEKHFRFKCDTKKHHHHFICTTCGKTKKVDTCPMDSLENDFKEFEITGHKFEIYGKCPECT